VAPSSKLGLSDVKIGIIPALGATTRLPTLMGMANAKELLRTEDLIGADRALEIGLFHRVVETQSLQATASELTEKLATRAPPALTAAKELLDTRAPLDQAGLIRPNDAREGMQNFLKKRSPRFKGS
jgi:enoyl-CoA hydratase/carnithine racemase